MQNGENHFTQSYKLGFSANIQGFNSGLSAEDLNGEILIPDSVSNNLRWKEFEINVEPNYEWKAGDFRMIAKLPLKYQFINSYDENYSQNNNDKRLLVNENLSIRYYKERGFSGSVYYIKTASAGDLLQSYSDLVLNDYRSFTQNNKIFSTSKRFNSGALLSYKNPVKILFLNLSAYYQEIYANNIAHGTVDQNLSYSERIPIANTASSFNLNSDISKYIFSIRSSLTFSYTFQSGKRKQFLNTLFYPFLTSSQSLGVKWNGRIGEKLRYAYDISHQSYLSKPKQYVAQLIPFEIKNTRQKLVLEYNIKENFFVKANSSFLNNKNDTGLNANYIFLDFAVRYKLKKQKIDFSLEARNLMNIKNHEVATTTLNTQSYYSYPLQGRMFIFKTQFTF